MCPGRSLSPSSSTYSFTCLAFLANVQTDTEVDSLTVSPPPPPPPKWLWHSGVKTFHTLSAQWSQNFPHTPSIAFQHRPPLPREGCCKPVLGVCNFYCWYIVHFSDSSLLKYNYCSYITRRPSQILRQLVSSWILTSVNYTGSA